MKVSQSNELIFKKLENLKSYLDHSASLKNCTLQGIDFTNERINWEQIEIGNTTLLGCQIAIEDELTLRGKGANIFIFQNHLPYKPYRTKLYSWQELMAGYIDDLEDSLDLKIYQHFSKTRFNPNVKEALYQRIHDHSIDDALRELLPFDEYSQNRKRCVGIMGGHNVLRTHDYFIKTAATAKLLTENNYFIASGGGPGIMEAANLGAYLAGYSDDDLKTALSILQRAPSYHHAQYLETSKEVLQQFPNGKENLAIPTWFYGHEPSNIFATHIAKYFSNSIREDTLLAIADHGIIFAPGSAGTTQEIFMDAAQNHYGTFNYHRPMIFLGKKRYEIETLIYPLLKQLSWGRTYNHLLHITDSPEDILEFLRKHPPIRKYDDED